MFNAFRGATLRDPTSGSLSFVLTARPPGSAPYDVVLGTFVPQPPGCQYRYTITVGSVGTYTHALGTGWIIDAVEGSTSWSADFYLQEIGTGYLSTNFITLSGTSPP